MKKLNKDRFGNPKTTPGVFKRQGIISLAFVLHACYLVVVRCLVVSNGASDPL